jgi:hypothetical protein
VTFKSTIETLSEAELDRVAGGMIKQPGPERPPATGNNPSGHELIEATPWNAHPPYTYLGPF